jgi:hypothetical protein
MQKTGWLDIEQMYLTHAICKRKFGRVKGALLY